MKKNILIVGGTGFIGFHISKLLKKKNKVFSLSKNKPKKNRWLNGVKYIFCDIFYKKKLYKKLEKENFDYVINLGGYVDHSNKLKTLQSHYYGCKNLVDYFKKKNIKLFIQIGSSLEYGKLKSPHNEKQKCKPTAIYGKSKYRSSQYILNSDKMYSFPYVILRLYKVFGPNTSKNRLIPIVISSCIKNKKFNCSSGIQKRDFLYIDDLVNLINKLILTKKEIKGIFNVGSGNPKSVRDTIEIIQKKIKRGKPQFGKIKMRKDESLNFYPKLNKIKKSINWKAKTNLSSGLSKTINSYK